jgi:hypothetical protein
MKADVSTACSRDESIYNNVRGAGNGAELLAASQFSQTDVTTERLAAENAER